MGRASLRLHRIDMVSGRSHAHALLRCRFDSLLMSGQLVTDRLQSLPRNLIPFLIRPQPVGSTRSSLRDSAGRSAVTGLPIGQRRAPGLFPDSLSSVIRPSGSTGWRDPDDHAARFLPLVAVILAAIGVGFSARSHPAIGQTLPLLAERVPGGDRVVSLLKAGFPLRAVTKGLAALSGGRLSAGSLGAVMMMHRLALLRL